MKLTNWKPARTLAGMIAAVAVALPMLPATAHAACYDVIERTTITTYYNGVAVSTVTVYRLLFTYCDNAE